jgi:hypothetical protein
MANNDLAVLERAYNPNRGIIGIRVAQVRTADLRRGARLKGEVLAELLPPLTMDNFEGLACRANEKGETILYLVSDNNFSDKQRTLLMMFAVVD